MRLEFHPPARYFPVPPGPYRSRAALVPWGKSFGNYQDVEYFQVDTDYPRYIVEKQFSPLRRGLIEDDSTESLHEAVLAWAEQTLLEEDHPAAGLYPTSHTGRAYENLCSLVAEDVVVHQKTPEGDRTVMMDVRFPTGWDGYGHLGDSFQQIHAAVPGLVDRPRKAEAFVEGMVGRGPFVRFVWTIVTLDSLSLHPDVARPAFSEAEKLWFRVERQVTIPFPEQNGSVFLIRVYNYPCESLTEEQKNHVISVLEQTHAEEAAHKGFDVNGPHMIRVLRDL